jgi:RNA polymerase sigma-70 factor (sigma-E family)
VEQGVQMRREDEAAFEAFVHAQATPLLRTAVLLVGDRGHAEDLLQTAFERTARHWTRLQGEPAAYTRTILANLVNDRWRRRRARVEEILLPDHDVPGSAVADLSSTVDLRESLLAGLRVLPPLQRTVLVLRYFEDLGETEVAGVLNISVGAVKSTASRAKARLREHLATADTDAKEGQP